MRVHDVERKNCDICDKPMKVSQMSKHKKSVHGGRNYPCELCSYKATTSYNIKLHMHSIHLGLKNIPKHQCSYCDYQTTNLDLHLKIRHPEKL